MIKKKLLKSNKKNDGIAYHHHYTGHKIDFTNTQILAEEKSYWRRRRIEGLEIRKLGENKANFQAGYEIHKCWGPMLDKLKSDFPSIGQCCMKMSSNLPLRI